MYSTLLNSVAPQTAQAFNEILQPESPNWNSTSPEIAATPMTESTLHSVFTSQDGHTTRLGWISFATGLTYCGICLGSAVEPRVGESCEACGAQVISVFDAANGAEAIRKAWCAAGMASTAPELTSLAS
jgi:hypothetical protein